MAASCSELLVLTCRLHQKFFIRPYQNYLSTLKQLYSTSHDGSSSDSTDNDHSSSDSSDDEKQVKKEHKTQEKRPPKISEKLNVLLSSLKVEPSIAPDKSSITLNLAKPQNKKKSEAERKQMEESFEGIEPEFVSAVKEVASSLGGNIENTKSELLNILKIHISETEMGKNAIQNEMTDISDTLAGMKIDKKVSGTQPTTTQYTATTVPPEHFRTPSELGQSITSQLKIDKQPQLTSKTIDMFNSPRLNIFDLSKQNLEEDKDIPVNHLWNQLAEHELQIMAVHPPRNAFEEMIHWTEQGKLWKFPIDNEQGMEEEKKVGFHEHVFLEHLLEGFPEKGPVRHYMELVITGLSKNPYITVERKKENVEWYRRYFKEKEEILKETGAI